MEKKIINIKVTENISFPEARKRFASFPLGRYADAARRGAERRFASAGTQYCETDCARPEPPAELLLATQPVTAPQGETSADAVTTNTVGSGSAPSGSTALAPSSLEGMEEMDTGGPAAASTSTPLPVPLLAPPAVAATAKGPQKGPKSKEPDESATPRTSDEDNMDVGPFLAASQRKERKGRSRSLEKDREKEKKRLPRITAPKDT